MARALELIGERWTLLIIRDARFRGSIRFVEFQKSLAIATNVLAKRLDNLVEAGVMSYDANNGAYHLSDSGNDLVTLLVAATEWGEKWAARGPIDFVDPHTGHRITAGLIDTVSGEQVASASVAVKLRD